MKIQIFKLFIRNVHPQLEATILKFVEGDMGGPSGTWIIDEDKYDEIMAGVPQANRPAVRKLSAPPPPTPEQQATAEARAVICEGCEQSRGVTRTIGNRNIYIVRCNLCGTCNGLSLISGTCHANPKKW